MNFVKSHFYNCFALYLKPRKYFSQIEAGTNPNPVLVLIVFFVNNVITGYVMEEQEYGYGFFIIVISITLFEYFLFYRLMNVLAVFLAGESNYKKLMLFAYSIQLPMAVLSILGAYLVKISGPVGILLVIFSGLIFSAWEAIIFLYCSSRIYKFSIGRTVLMDAMVPFSIVLVLGSVLCVMIVSLQFF